MKRPKPYARTPHAPTIRELRCTAMQRAALARDPDTRLVYVAMAREINHVLVRSDQRRRECFNEFKAVLEGLT